MAATTAIDRSFIASPPQRQSPPVPAGRTHIDPSKRGAPKEGRPKDISFDRGSFAAERPAFMPLPAIASRVRLKDRLPDHLHWVRAGESGIHGRGVYARRTIPSGVRIIEYVGEKITKAESHRRELRRLARQRRGGDECVTIFDLNRRFDLDGRTRRNIARLINHSCAPNCRSETIRGRIWILAQREIAPGEELTFDYGYAFKEWPLHPCRCGAKNCAGYIVNGGQRWRVRRLVRARERAAEKSTRLIPGKSGARATSLKLSDGISASGDKKTS